MKLNSLSILLALALAGALAGCASTIPRELADARQAYRQASHGPAARVAPAELHLADQALARAEQSFLENPEGYRTRDLAYVAQRKSQLAAAIASVTIERNSQAQAKDDYRQTQGEIVTKTKHDLDRTRTALEASEQSGAVKEQDLDKTRKALVASEHSGDVAEQDLSETRTALAASERSGDATAERLAAEQEARAAADQRAAVAQAALAKLAAVKEEPRGMVITLSGSVLFATNQTSLLPEAQTRLDQVAEVLLTNRERNLTIEGHTDSQGSDSSNLTLSQGRADAVRSYLVKRGYQADLIQAHGLGEGHPIADNANAEGRANNRRVEIIIDREAHASNP
jgi:outer membrane protein OmpA-like peptidoglycan-associated protein